MALIAQQATLACRIPFLHFFDGFRTSHEVQKVEELTYDDMRAMIDDKLVAAHKARALSPDRPTMSGTAQNPDVYFQGRETVNKFYLATPKIVQDTMDKFAKIVGRQYHLFDYVGAPDAEKVIIIMCSGADTVHETVDYLVGKGEKVGVLNVRLYRPFSVGDFIEALPENGHEDRGSGPHEGTRLHRRTAVYGYSHGNRRSDGRRDRSIQEIPVDRRWSLRPGLEGIYAGDGQGGL